MQEIRETLSEDLQYVTDWRECAPPELRKVARYLTRSGLRESLQEYVARVFVEYASTAGRGPVPPIRVLVLAWRFEGARLLGLCVGTRGPVDDPNMPACEIEEDCTREEWVEAGMQFLGPVPEYEDFFTRERAPAPRNRRQARKARRLEAQRNAFWRADP